MYFFGKDGTIDVLTPSSQQLKSIALLPQDNNADGGPFSGSVLYAAALTEHGLVIRRGQNLYFVATLIKSDEN